jgi:hypothetical protein
MEAPVEAPATRSSWRRSRSFVQPLLITMVGVVASFSIAVAIFAGVPYLIGVLITGILTAMSSKDLRRGAIAAVVAVGILWLALSVWADLTDGYAGAPAIVQFGVYAAVTLLPLGLGFGVGAAIVIALRRRRGDAGDTKPR